MKQLGCCKNCGRMYDEAESDDGYCLDCPADYDQEIIKLIDEIKNDKQQED